MINSKSKTDDEKGLFWRTSFENDGDEISVGLTWTTSCMQRNRLQLYCAESYSGKSTFLSRNVAREKERVRERGRCSNTASIFKLWCSDTEMTRTRSPVSTFVLYVKCPISFYPQTKISSNKFCLSEATNGLQCAVESLATPNCVCPLISATGALIYSQNGFQIFGIFEEHSHCPRGNYFFNVIQINLKQKENHRYSPDKSFLNSSWAYRIFGSSQLCQRLYVFMNELLEERNYLANSMVSSRGLF